MNHKLDTNTQIFFYEQEYYVFSNFSSFQVTWNGYHFSTAEHAYHFAKFGYIDDSVYENPVLSRDIANQVFFANSAHKAFKLAQENKQHQRKDWDEVKEGVMLSILRAKVDQHPYVRKKLLESGDRELIEDSWRDGYWGWGPNKDGQNRLGKLWMQVREEIKKDVQP